MSDGLCHCVKELSAVVRRYTKHLGPRREVGNKAHEACHVKVGASWYSRPFSRGKQVVHPCRGTQGGFGNGVSINARQNGTFGL